METQYNRLSDALIGEAIRRICEESIPRIEKCLNKLDEEEVWHRPNESLVSIGNLTLHVIGNARQWVVSGLGGFPDMRQRRAEFSEESRKSKEELLEDLRQLKVDIQRVLPSVNPDQLLKKRPVQIYNETGVAILIHATEHFSYHTGQISWHTKLLKNEDLNYYPEI